MRRSICGLVIAVGLTWNGTALVAGSLAFEEIRLANGDGSGQQLVVPGSVAEGRGVLALGGQSIYWVGGAFETDIFGTMAWIRRADLSGAGQHDLLGPSHWGGIAVDTLHGKLYLTPQSDCAPNCTSVIRSNLNGSSVEPLFPAGFPGSIAVHAAQELVCWSDLFLGEDFEQGIACAHVGDAEGQIVVPETANGVAIDAGNDKLYWTRDDRIRRSNLDGSNIEDLVTGLTSAEGIAIDPQGGHLWWTELSSGRIRRANLDGSGIVDVVVDQDRPSGIAFLPVGGGAEGKIYWLDLSTGSEVPAVSPWGVVLLAFMLLGIGTARALRVRHRAHRVG